MPLQKQQISLPCASGITNDLDDKQGQAGTFELVENAELSKLGKFKKVKGYSPLSSYDTAGNKLTFKTLASRGEELLGFTNTNMYSYIEDESKWINKGNINNISAVSRTVYKSAYEQSQLDCLYLEGLSIFTYIQGAAGVYFSIVDNNTNAVIASQVLVDAAGTQPRLAHIGNEVVIVYNVTTDLKYKKFTISNPTSLSSATTLVADVRSSYKFDLCSVANKIVIVYSRTNSGAHQLVYMELDDTFTLGTISDIGSESGANGVAVNLTTAGIAVVWHDGTDLFTFIRRINNSGYVLSKKTIGTIANVTSFTGIVDGRYYHVYYTVSNATSHFYKLYRISYTLSTGAVYSAAAVFKRSVGLAGKAFVADSTHFIPAIYVSTLQPTRFLLSAAGYVASMEDSGLAGTHIQETSAKTIGLPSVCAIDSYNFVTASSIKGVIDSNGSAFSTVLGVSSVVYSVGNNVPITHEFSGNLFIQTGFLGVYEGSNLVESGYFVYPEQPTIADSATAGSLVDTKTYQYKLVYSWFDSNGEQHRSAPSVTKSHTLGGTGKNSVDLTIPTLHLTHKSGVTIEIYRTEEGKTIFYRLTSLSAPTFNNDTVDTISYNDGTADASLIGGELLYTTGGYLENIVPCQTTYISSTNERMFIVKDFRVIFSKMKEEGKPVEWNDTLYHPFNNKITAIKVMDDKTVVFTPDSIYGFTGTGPTNTGVNDDFTDMHLMSDKVGCINSKACSVTSEGILFQSRKGLYLMDHAQTLIYLGKDVKDYNIDFIGIIEHKLKNELRCFSSLGTCLIYNYERKQWTIASNVFANSVSMNGALVKYVCNGSVYRESDNFQINGTPINLKVRTNWLSFDHVQNYQRVYRMFLMGTFKSAHKLKIRVAYNFVDAWIDEQSITVGVENHYGDGSTYGSDAVYGTQSNRYQARVNFSKQKCSAMKIEIEDMSEGGESLELSNLCFVVGIKSSANQLDEDSTATA